MEANADVQQKLRAKKRGVRLATIGLILACLVSAILEILGILPYRGLNEWLLLFSLIVGIQGIVWVILYTGLHQRIYWDQHYIYVPLFGVAILFNLFVYIDPSLRHPMLMVWLVSLLFTAGLANFYGIAIEGLVMTLGYVIAIAFVSQRDPNISVVFETVIAVFFLTMNLFAAIVFKRLHSDRQAMISLRRKLAELALSDPLTALPNRRQFEQRLASEFARVERYRTFFSVVMIDVDHFKNYNDLWGHPAGDNILVAIVKVIVANLRTGDFAARYGGEEFVLILPNTRLEDGVRMVERLRKAIESCSFEGREVQPGGRITVSAGVAECCEPMKDLASVLHQADQALYTAKSQGRNRVVSAPTLVS